MSQRAKTPSLPVTLATTLALIDQFSASLFDTSTPPSSSSSSSSSSTTANAPSPLLLLAAAAKSLRAQVTKLSLLTVTGTAATPSATAVAATLQSVNDSVLPSLVTASLLVSADAFTASFSTRCRKAVQTTLKNLKALVVLVSPASASASAGKSSGNHDSQSHSIPEDKKREITEATGRVWEDCDGVVALADGGIPAFVVTQANQWLDLMKDAVAELQEWDPEGDQFEDDDLFGDEIGSHNGDADEDEDAQDRDGSEKDNATTIAAGVKDQVLKVLSRIPQSVHVVVKQRLEKLRAFSSSSSSSQQQHHHHHHQLSSDVRARLDPTLTRLRNISELIDESAEAMYLANPELCLKKAGEARAVTIELVENALLFWQTQQDQKTSKQAGGQSQEDKYVKRALDWIRQAPGAQTTTATKQ